jgi:hypothetical protein
VNATIPATLPSLPFGVHFFAVDELSVAGAFSDVLLPQAEPKARSDNTMVSTSQTFVCLVNIFNPPN